MAVDGLTTFEAPRSPRVLNALAYLLESGNSTASKLADVMATHSRFVYPLLKPWVLRGVVAISKIGRRNVYSISQNFRKLISDVMKRFSLKGRDFIVSKAVSRYKKFMGKDPDSDVMKVIEYFVDKALTGNPYVQGTESESVAEILSRALKIPIHDVAQILRELAVSNIIFVWKNRKARLESSLLHAD